METQPHPWEDATKAIQLGGPQPEDKWHFDLPVIGDMVVPAEQVINALLWERHHYLPDPFRRMDGASDSAAESDSQPSVPPPEGGVSSHPPTAGNLEITINMQPVERELNRMRRSFTILSWVLLGQLVLIGAVLGYSLVR